MTKMTPLQGQINQADLGGRKESQHCKKNEQELITTDEIQRRLGVSRTTLYNWRNKKLEFRQVN
jgi:hypothetical protein